MKDIESKVRASLSSALDDVQGRSDIESIRRRAGRQRNVLIAGGLTATVAVAILASSLLGGRSSPTIVAEPPHGISPTFGRYAIKLGQGFDGDGNPITATGIVEVDAKRNELCIDASVKGVTQVHLHQRETGDQISLPDRPQGCFVSPPDVVDDILAHHEQWYIEIHNTDSGATIQSNLQPISNLPDPEAPCDLLEEDEMSAAARIEINGGGEVPSRPDPQGRTVALCRYFAQQPYTSLTIYIDDGVTGQEFEEKLNRDPINTVELDGIGDAAYIHAGVSLTVLVDDVTTTATVQHFGTVEETRRMLTGLGRYIAQELREHLGHRDEEQLACEDDPPPSSASAAFLPPSARTEGPNEALPVVFADGTTAEVVYPSSLQLDELSVRPDMVGGPRGGMVRPQISYGTVHFDVTGPVDCVEGKGGRRHPLWDWKGRDRVLILRFGDWYVSVFDRYADPGLWAKHLDGQLQAGWLTLESTAPLLLGPDFRPGDSNLMFSDRHNILNLWPLDCRLNQNTDEGQLQGPGENGGTSFVSFCIDDVNVEVHAQGRERFVRAVADGLTVRNVDLAHPLENYSIIP